MQETKQFTMEELAHHIPLDLLYQKNYDSATSSPFSWNKEMPLQEMASTSEGPAEILRATSLAIGVANVPQVTKIDPRTRRKIVEEDIHPNDEKPKNALQKCLHLCCGRCMKKKKKEDPEVEIGKDGKPVKKHHHHHHKRKKQGGTEVDIAAHKPREKTQLELITEENQKLEEKLENLRMHIEVQERVIRRGGFGDALDRWKRTGSIKETSKVNTEFTITNFEEARKMLHSFDADRPAVESYRPAMESSKYKNEYDI